MLDCTIVHNSMEDLMYCLEVIHAMNARIRAPDERAVTPIAFTVGSATLSLALTAPELRALHGHVERALDELNDRDERESP